MFVVYSVLVESLECTNFGHIYSPDTGSSWFHMAWLIWWWNVAVLKLDQQILKDPPFTRTLHSLLISHGHAGVSLVPDLFCRCQWQWRSLACGQYSYNRAVVSPMVNLLSDLAKISVSNMSTTPSPHPQSPYRLEDEFWHWSFRRRLSVKICNGLSFSYYPCPQIHPRSTAQSRRSPC